MNTKIVPMHQRTAQVVLSLQDAIRKESTLEQIIENPAIKALASSDELSKPRRGLIAATVSIMQDKLIAQ